MLHAMSPHLWTRSMCGITGRINLDRSPVDRSGLERAREALASRGPDGAGIWIDGHVGMAHRRLAVLDLSERGHQPMTTADEKLTLTYNGEIFNFSEIRAELSSLGHRFRSDSDTEVILIAYRQWGIDCLQKFNGMFAFALWDKSQQTLFLARDRLGVKPLYYTHNSRRLAFASTLSSLKGYGDAPTTIDQEALSLYFQMSYVPGPHSICSGIRKLPPACYLQLGSDGKASITRYWKLPHPPENSDDRVSDMEAVENLEKLLRSSVRYRLVSDVPVGAFLSGGIDSALIVALMRLEASDVHTFTIGFEDKAHDESVYAKAIATHLGTNHTDLVVTESDLELLAESLPSCYDEPFADASSIPTMALSVLTRKHVTVALSGDGGDELFCGYPYYQFMARLDPWRRCLSRAGSVWEAMSTLVPHKGAMALRALSQRSSTSLFAYMRGPLKSRSYRWLAPGISSSASEFMEGIKAASDNSTRAFMDLDLKTYLPDDILVKVDRASMAVGLEARTPFLDFRFVEAVAALPDQQRTRAGKPLLKSMLSRHLPKELFDRPKHGFTVPIRKWLRTSLRSRLTGAIESGELSSSGFIDRKAARILLAEHMSGRRNHENMLWAILCFELWHEKQRG